MTIISIYTWEINHLVELQFLFIKHKITQARWGWAIQGEDVICEGRRGQ